VEAADVELEDEVEEEAGTWMLLATVGLAATAEAEAEPEAAAGEEDLVDEPEAAAAATGADDDDEATAEASALPLPADADPPFPSQLLPVNPAGAVGFDDAYFPPYATFEPGFGNTTSTPSIV